MRLLDALPVTHAEVRLRPLAERDAVAYAEGTTDTAVRRFAHLPLPEYTADTVRELIHGACRTGLADGTLAVLTIADVPTDVFLGSLVLFDISAEQAEVGFWLAPQARGRAAAAQALVAARILAARLRLQTLTARTDPSNTASHRTLTAAGFTAEATPRQTTTPSGTRMDTQHYILALT